MIGGESVPRQTHGVLQVRKQSRQLCVEGEDSYFLTPQRSMSRDPALTPWGLMSLPPRRPPHAPQFLSLQLLLDPSPHPKF